jgi:NAD(P)-dependent dehydrogenase (short-subunit alcohol dehydrogenase family)
MLQHKQQLEGVPSIKLELSKPHALVVGGTGMLWAVSLELARRGYSTSVIARRKPRLQKLSEAAHAVKGFINPITIDVHKERELAVQLRDAMQRFGPIALVVDWASPNDSLTIAKLVGNPLQPCEFFHILGSSVADPSQPDLQRRARFKALLNIRYHEVILGFVIEDRRSRWLTHEEICRGIFQAIDANTPRFIVGTVEPWSARP